MIETKYGKLEGRDHGWYETYFGVPYAQPPVGDLRWRAPVPPQPWEGVRPAKEFSGKAWQAEGSSPPWDKDFYDDPHYEYPSTEDCLYLNIWAPKGGKDLPVAFWIHGGAFMGGNGMEKEFDGVEYARRGVLLVTVNYRLGVFGFLAHPWLTEEAGVSGNYGSLDQIAALNWVYENIAAFGGDPKNITVFGQSAGAMSTQTLISSPLTEDKIARAILQSGGSYGAGLHRDIPLADQEEYGALFAESVGARDLADLRSRPAEEIFRALGAFLPQIMGRAGGLIYAPTLDGKLLTAGYYETMDRGEIKRIPYLLGCTKDDIRLAPDAPAGRDSDLYKGCLAFSHKLEDLGWDPAYVYYFDRDLPGDDQGAWHSSELWYTFGTLGRCWRPWAPEDYALSARMLDYWTNFMKTGDPNGPGLPAWKPCTQADPYVQDLGCGQ